METSLNNHMMQLALIGIEHHCHADALAIADWLECEQHAEAASMIRLCSLMGSGKYEEALALGKAAGWPSLTPWLALCELRLGLGVALEQRLLALSQSDEPALRQFADGLRQQVIE
ncbi:YscG family type III secretion system chaperone [Pseudomonas entomophila]|uniref:YscG family type III secretion system chaperone n=1 Tax=Pseudomonas entomophila TaxID=312306 RepID=UPI001F00459E|nr:YscG family type III secretion system chaperone [Pseudomonas entomophila]MCG8291433.1 YscG family type III secretion system chaperone [Pseudomonas entomophila]